MRKRLTKLKKKYGDFCLLFGNFGKVNNASLKDENEYIENVIKEGTLKRNSDEYNYVKNNLLVQKKIFSKIPSLIESFSKNFPDKKLIVRPHPVESKEIYLKITKDLKNVKVVFDDTNAISWIKAADFSISSNCTTAVESYLCNKLSINFWPFNDDMETYSYHLPLKVALQGNSPDQVISQIKNIYEKNNFDISNYLNLNLVNDHLKKSFFNFRNNKCSVSEVLNYVNKIDIMTERDDKNTGFLYFYYYHLRTIFKKINFSH